ncbi:Cystatin/monellin superfamily protein [Hirschfeldia incana]|nr:Cystatin/monellin superfamily protein [Hirschfeldia incana]
MAVQMIPISIRRIAPTGRWSCLTKSWIGAGLGYEIDFKKFRYCFGWRPFHLDDVSFFSDPETNRHFVAKLVNLALDQHNEEKKTSLELGKILIANFHPSCGMTFYISFEVNDPSDSQTKPYRAVVRYFPGDIEVISCNPKEESC